MPFDISIAEKAVAQFGTPIYLYDEAGIRRTARELNKAFSWAKNYKNYFAVKATPTPGIMKILHEEGMGFDCSSRGELVIAQRIGIDGKDIFYTSNNTPKEDFELAIELGATITLDDISHLDNFASALKGNHLRRVAARYNPGNLKHGNFIIGEPTEAKYGMDTETLIATFKELKKLNIAEFGLHTMVASNELDEPYFEDTAEILLNSLEKIENAVGIKISFVNIGGGFGLNYLTDEAPFDPNVASDLIRKVFEKHGSKIELATENGRYVTGPHGYMLTRARYVMHKYKDYVGVDASMNNLMRPGMYGAYHHITVLGKENAPSTETFDIVGALCENNDKFAINRELPKITEGDILVVHDAGAHGHAMGSNYNGLLRCAEVILTGDKTFKLVRRAETMDDLLRTIVQ